MIRILKGVSGYRFDGSSYSYGAGRSVEEIPEIEKDLVKAGLAEYDDKKTDRPIAEPPTNFAVVPSIRRKELVYAVLKPRRNV